MSGTREKHEINERIQELFGSQDGPDNDNDHEPRTSRAQRPIQPLAEEHFNRLERMVSKRDGIKELS